MIFFTDPSNIVAADVVLVYFVVMPGNHDQSCLWATRRKIRFRLRVKTAAQETDHYLVVKG